MAATERDAFLARFTDDGCGIGFRRPGRLVRRRHRPARPRLIGAFIATLGLPPLNPVNETLRCAWKPTFGAGYAYTYLYPGIQKVVQAAGRVIRSEHDRGVVYLLDDRYGRDEVRRLLPRWWAVETVVLPGVAEASTGGRPSLPRTEVRSPQSAAQRPGDRVVRLADYP